MLDLFYGLMLFIVLLSGIYVMFIGINWDFHFKISTLDINSRILGLTEHIT